MWYYPISSSHGIPNWPPAKVIARAGFRHASYHVSSRLFFIYMKRMNAVYEWTWRLLAGSWGWPIVSSTNIRRTWGYQYNTVAGLRVAPQVDEWAFPGDEVIIWPWGGFEREKLRGSRLANVTGRSLKGFWLRESCTSDVTSWRGPRSYSVSSCWWWRPYAPPASTLKVSLFGSVSNSPQGNSWEQFLF